MNFKQTIGCVCVEINTLSTFGPSKNNDQWVNWAYAKSPASISLNHSFTELTYGQAWKKFAIDPKFVGGNIITKYSSTSQSQCNVNDGFL